MIGVVFILPFIDIFGDYAVLLIFFIIMYWISLGWIRGNKEKSGYTKNIKLNRRRKLLLGFFFYKGDKVEMEAVINQILNYTLTIIIAIISLYKEIEPKTFGICYGIAFFSALGGCLIYRFKKDDFKDINEHY